MSHGGARRPRGFSQETLQKYKRAVELIAKHRDSPDVTLKVLFGRVGIAPRTFYLVQSRMRGE